MGTRIDYQKPQSFRWELVDGAVVAVMDSAHICSGRGSNRQGRSQMQIGTSDDRTSFWGRNSKHEKDSHSVHIAICRRSVVAISGGLNSLIQLTGRFLIFARLHSNTSGTSSSHLQSSFNGCSHVGKHSTTKIPMIRLTRCTTTFCKGRLETSQESSLSGCAIVSAIFSASLFSSRSRCRSLR
jgi:hypothetical protein